MGADPLASAVSTMSYLAGRPLHAFYVRKEPKGHGTGQWIEGMSGLRPAMKVAILEDVVTTGGSAMKAITRVREAGLEVACIIGLVDREEGGREVLEKEAPLHTMFRKRDFVAK
jgi:orotate phosphoribosyltransferase